MRRGDHKAGGTFGFARQPEESEPSAVSPPAAQPDEPVQASVDTDQHWVMRPRAQLPAAQHELLAESQSKSYFPRFRRPARAETVPAPMPASDASSKRWLAIGLFGIVYVVGLAGLWSIYQRFDKAEPMVITPAGHQETVPLPPVDDEVDIRDASLDGPIRPKLRPKPDEDAKGSDLQPI